MKHSIDVERYDEARCHKMVGHNVCVLGYGSQGRAQSLNLRDSGLNVLVGNLNDRYREIAEADGFSVSEPREAVKDADVILFLIPDHAQPDIYERISPYLNDGVLLIFAHGFSLFHESFSISEKIDVGLLAPRMPGKPIREFYLEGSGAPAFYAVVQDYSGNCKNRILGLADNLGFTKRAVIPTSIAEETTTDLFLEQYTLPLMMSILERTFEFLISKGVSSEVAHLETYSSGELSNLLSIAGKEGLYQTWTNHASPTCRFGIMEAMTQLRQSNNLNLDPDSIWRDIENRSFFGRLQSSYQSGMIELTEFDNTNNEMPLSVTQQKVNEILE
ncbi:NAD(P)-binding domain-containing protein [Litorivicinus sp.]|nr:NAD(P)-binding domain-containing protein [Litorivicinus sp.]